MRLRIVLLLVAALIATGCAGERPELVAAQTTADPSADPAADPTTADDVPATSLPPQVTDCTTAVGVAPFPVTIEPGPAPVPCVRVAGFQRLEIVNNTVDTVGFSLGATPFQVEPGMSLVTEPLGSLLGPGLNDPAATPHPLVAPWLIDGAESPLGGAQMLLTGIGPIRLGMTADEATAAAGVAFTEPAQEGCAVVSIADDPHSPLFTLRDQRVTVVQIFGAGQLTPSSVGVGTPEADVAAAYGAQLETQPSPDGDASKKLLVFVPADEIDKQYRLIFEIGNGVVTSVRSGFTSFAATGAAC